MAEECLPSRGPLQSASAPLVFAFACALLSFVFPWILEGVWGWFASLLPLSVFCLLRLLRIPPWTAAFSAASVCLWTDIPTARPARFACLFLLWHPSLCLWAAPRRALGLGVAGLFSGGLLWLHEGLGAVYLGAWMVLAVLALRAPATGSRFPQWELLGTVALSFFAGLAALVLVDPQWWMDNRSSLAHGAPSLWDLGTAFLAAGLAFCQPRERPWMVRFFPSFLAALFFGCALAGTSGVSAVLVPQRLLLLAFLAERLAPHARRSGPFAKLGASYRLSLASRRLDRV